jgi:beta-galactosidase
MSAPASPPVAVHPHGFFLAAHGEALGRVLPLRVASFHYFHHEPALWGPALDAFASLGFTIIDTYIPWGIHEISSGNYDFGARKKRLDLRAFLREVAARGLFALVRPGPHINGELSFFGLPERVVWDPPCQARTPKGNPVVLPMLPLAFPVPSYASSAFHAEAAQWLMAAAKEMADLTYPEGPIVAVQIDNEGALYFRDGPYDQDFHPDAVAAYRDFLRKRYATAEALQAAYEDENLDFSTMDPPRRFDGKALPRHLEWMEFQEDLLARAMGRFADALTRGGLTGIPTTHNFPLGEAASPLNAARIGDVVDLVALDYYHRATPEQHSMLARRTTELAAFSEARGRPAYGAEVGVGFPPFFPPLDEKDSEYTLLAALAYGLRGYNLYMAMDRDRWLGAPITKEGFLQPSAAFYRRLNEALERLAFHTLRRRVPVRLLVPRALRRLARASHAFGPLSPSAFHVMGRSVAESCFEEDLGLGPSTASEDGDSTSPVVLADAFLRRVAEALEIRGVPYAFSGGEGVRGDLRAVSRFADGRVLRAGTSPGGDPHGATSDALVGASWVVVAAAHGLKPELVETLRTHAQQSGHRVTLGPTAPTLDGALRPLTTPFDGTGFALVDLWDGSGAADAVADAIRAFHLPTFPVEGQAGFITVHETEAGEVRAVFAMNPYPEDRVIAFALPGVRALQDALTPTADGPPAPLEKTTGAFRIPVPARSVRLFSVVRDGAS